jgi:hypothetical protein
MVLKGERLSLFLDSINERVLMRVQGEGVGLKNDLKKEQSTEEWWDLEAANHHCRQCTL